jgi:glucose/arabinose dehydrogenase
MAIPVHSRFKFRARYHLVHLSSDIFVLHTVAVHPEAHASLGWLIHAGENSRRLRSWVRRALKPIPPSPALTLAAAVGLCLVTNWVGAVELPPGFSAETLATNLNAATAIAPATDGRIYLGEQTGFVRVWQKGRLAPRPLLTLHVTDYWERGLIGLTLHPDFPGTPHLYVLYVTDRPVVHHVLSRFTVPPDAEAMIEPGTELVLFEGDDQSKLGGTVPAGHQGGPLRFGPDGNLYVGLGEQTAGEPAQRLDTLQGKILRLTPDGTIPGNNPLLDRTQGKYRAIFAYGIRNPYGLAWQRESGRGFFTDVGGSAFEEVNELAPGANYGWPRAEGYSTNAIFRSPLFAYPPLVGQSIVGGAFIPSASLWPQKWRSRFLFADFMKHWLKALDPDHPTNILTFARGLNGPVATEVAADGSLLVLNRGAVWRDPKKFVPNSGSLIRIRFVGEARSERSLAAAAARARSAAALGLPMEPALLPKQLTASDWEERLQKNRAWPIWNHSRPWHHGIREAPTALYLPPNAHATLSALNEPVQLPPGAVVVREFGLVGAALEPEAKPRALKRIETRLLVSGSPRSYGASYHWRTQTVADLIEDGELATLGGANWWFPALDDALSSPITNPSYWISTAPVDLVLPAPDPRTPGFPTPANGLLAMLTDGALATSLSATAISNIPPGVRWEMPNPRGDLETRVRSYLHGNCAVCHQPGGPSRGQFDARLTTPLTAAGIINGELAAGDLGIPGAKVVVPGNPEKSMLYRRLKTTDFFRMPPAQTHNEPSPILPVVEEWIRTMR